MCGGSKTSTSKSSTTADPAFRGPAIATIGQAQQVAQTPYTAYTGQRVADFTPDQMAAFQSVRNNQGIASPYIDQAAQYSSQSAAPITSADITASLDSTGLGQQITALQNLFNQQNATANSTVTGNAALKGALGGNRVGVAQALTQQAQTLAQAPQMAAAYNTAYGQAANLAQANRAAQAQAANAYGALGQQAQNSAALDAQNLVNSGTLQQQQEQNVLNVPYQDYLTQQAYPFQTTQWLAGILGALGPSLGSQSSSSTPGPSTLSQILGLGATGLGAFMASDERIKENIAPVGELFDGTPIYRYNLAGEPQTQIGVLAQDVEQTNPAAVAEGPGGLKLVDYDTATRPALQAQARLGTGLGDEAGFAMGGAVAPPAIDPEFSALADKLNHAAGKIRATMPQPMAAGGIPGGITMPTAVDPNQAGTSQVSAAPIVPQNTLSPAAPLQSHAEKGANPNASVGSSLASIGQSLGGYFARNAMPSQASWEAGTSVSPTAAGLGNYADNATAAAAATPVPSGIGGFLSGLGGLFSADGGVVREPAATGGFFPRGRPNAAPTPGTPVAMDDDSPDAFSGAFSNAFNSAPKMGGEPVSLGAGDDPTFPSTGAATPFSNVEQPDRIVPDATPAASMPYEPPMALGASDLAAGDAQQGTFYETPQAAPPAAAPEKAWYEYGSNPTLGTALMAAGLGTMSGTSPYAGVNVGAGGLTGLNTYLQQRSSQRAFDLKQEEIERQAKLLAMQVARQNEIERANREREARFSRVDEERERHNRETEEAARRASDPSTLAAKKRQSERIEAEEKMRTGNLGDAQVADEMARQVRSLRDMIVDEKGNPKVDPAILGPVSSSWINNTLVATLPEMVTNITGAVSDALTGQESRASPTQRMEQRQQFESRLQMLNAAITAAANKGQGSVSDAERILYGKVITSLMAGNIQGGIKQLDSLITAFSEKAAAARERAEAPPVGYVEDRYRFKGGDPSDRNNWEPVQ